MLEQQAEKASYFAGVIGTFIGAWTLRDWFMAVSILSIVATYFTNLYFKIRADRRGQKQLKLEEESRDDQ